MPRVRAVTAARGQRTPPGVALRALRPASPPRGRLARPGRPRPPAPATQSSSSGPLNPAAEPRTRLPRAYRATQRFWLCYANKSLCRARVQVGRSGAGLGMDQGMERRLPDPPSPAHSGVATPTPLPLMLRQRIGHRRVGWYFPTSPSLAPARSRRLSPPELERCLVGFRTDERAALTQRDGHPATQKGGPSVAPGAAGRGALWPAPVLPSVSYTSRATRSVGRTRRAALDSASALRVCCGTHRAGMSLQRLRTVRVG